MILKLLINFYHWLWDLPPLDTTSEWMDFVLFASAWIDICVIGSIIMVFVNRILDRRFER